jgi:hypothetical protein
LIVIWPTVAREAWIRDQRAKLSHGNEVAKAMDYMLKCWTAFTRFLDDGRICLSNDAAERGVRGIAFPRNRPPKYIVEIPPSAALLGRFQII